MKVLHTVTEGNQAFDESINRVEFVQYDKVVVKMSWLFFVKELELMCYSENCEIFVSSKTRKLLSNVSIILAFGKKHVKQHIRHRNLQ